MQINSDINILGGMPDFDLVVKHILTNVPGRSDFTTRIRTVRAIKRFEKAIETTFLGLTDKDLNSMIVNALENEGVSDDSSLLLFWLASANNDLFDHLNTNVYFPALYSGRTNLGKNEVIACLQDLQATEDALREWSPYTIELTGSKYLTLLKKFRLLDGKRTKTIKHPHLSDKAFVLFVYWLAALEKNSNVLVSNWFQYGFSERGPFVERLRQHRFAKYVSIKFVADSLSVETLVGYGDIYDAIIKSNSGI